MNQENFSGIVDPYVAKQGDIVRIEIWIPPDTQKSFRAAVKTITNEGIIATVQAIDNSLIYVKDLKGQFVLNNSIEDNQSIKVNDILPVETIDSLGQATAHLEQTVSESN